MVLMKYLLDTNIISELVKNEPNQAVLLKLDQYQHEVVTAAPIWHELQYGCRRLPQSRKRKIIESFLYEVLRPNMMILPYDEQAAEWHARERARLSSQGRMPPFVDGQIAAIAKVHGLTLVTRNIQDFELFSDLVLENWHEP